MGPGKGILTEFLLERKNPLTAVDIDQESITFLKDQFPDRAEDIVHADFLRQPLNDPVTIIGNFPYNISSQIFFKIWENFRNTNCIKV